jgi:hypothetical protein
MRKLALILATSGLSWAGAASAAEYDFTFTNPIGGVWAEGTLTTSDTLNALGGYDIVGISGTTPNGAITGLITASFSPAYAYYFPDGHVSQTPDFGFEWGFDDTLFPDGNVQVDDYGFMFQTATTIYNIFNNYGVPGQDSLGISALGVWDGTSWSGTFAITSAQASAPAPEPLSWMMMVGGFGLLGSVLRLRKRHELLAI